jgi:hypothetical protein
MGITFPLLQAMKLTDSIKNVQMHQHMAHPPGPEPTPSLMDNISDTLLNAFSRVRKPDERFTEMRDEIDKFEEGLQNIERLWGWTRARANGNPIFMRASTLPEYQKL